MLQDRWTKVVQNSPLHFTHTVTRQEHYPCSVNDRPLQASLPLKRNEYTGWSDVTAIWCCRITISVEGKLSGEDLSTFCSNKIKSVGLRNFFNITILLRKWFHNNIRFSELSPHRGEKTISIDMVWRNYTWLSPNV